MLWSKETAVCQVMSACLLWRCSIQVNVSADLSKHAVSFRDSESDNRIKSVVQQTKESGHRHYQVEINLSSMHI